MEYFTNMFTFLFRMVALVVLIFVGILFPLNSFAAAATVDTSYNACASEGSSRASSGLGHFSTGIVGVNSGSDWTKNSCLGDEIHHFDNYALYVNTNYPSDGCHTAENRTDAFNCGYNLGLFDVNYASSQGAHSNTWFEDVEGGPGTGIPWATDSLNSSFLWGLEVSLRLWGAGTIGFYSTASQWQSITGNWHNDNDGWYATGVNGTPSASTIHNACHSNFTGGHNVYYQYIVGGLSGGLDYDGSC
jgi:hypothetical protein